MYRVDALYYYELGDVGSNVCMCFELRIFGIVYHIQNEVSFVCSLLLQLQKKP